MDYARTRRRRLPNKEEASTFSCDPATFPFPSVDRTIYGVNRSTKTEFNSSRRIAKAYSPSYNSFHFILLFAPPPNWGFTARTDGLIGGDFQLPVWLGNSPMIVPRSSAIIKTSGTQEPESRTSFVDGTETPVLLRLAGRLLCGRFICASSNASRVFYGALIWTMIRDSQSRGG